MSPRVPYSHLFAMTNFVGIWRLESFTSDDFCLDIVDSRSREGKSPRSESAASSFGHSLSICTEQFHHTAADDYHFLKLIGIELSNVNMVTTCTPFSVHLCIWTCCLSPHSYPWMQHTNPSRSLQLQKGEWSLFLANNEI